MGVVKFGGFHSEKYWPRELTSSTAGSSLAPTGVRRPPASAATTGTAASFTSRAWACRSRTSPTIATAEMITPSGHIPWHIAQTQINGTSHHAERREPARSTSTG